MTWCTVVCWTLYSYIHICIIVYDLQWSPIPYTIYILNKKLITYFLLSICCSSIQFPSPKKINFSRIFLVDILFFIIYYYGFPAAIERSSLVLRGSWQVVGIWTCDFRVVMCCALCAGPEGSPGGSGQDRDLSPTEPRHHLQPGVPGASTSYTNNIQYR